VGVVEGGACAIVLGISGKDSPGPFDVEEDGGVAGKVGTESGVGVAVPLVLVTGAEAAFESGIFSGGGTVMGTAPEVSITIPVSGKRADGEMGLGGGVCLAAETGEGEGNGFKFVKLVGRLLLGGLATRLTKGVVEGFSLAGLGRVVCGDAGTCVEVALGVCGRLVAGLAIRGCSTQRVPPEVVPVFSNLTCPGAREISGDSSMTIRVEPFWNWETRIDRTAPV
jgi:hypothetical protein